MPSLYKFKKGFKTFAEKKSIELRTQLSIKPSHPMPASRLAEHMGIIVESPEHVPGIDKQTLEVLLQGAKSHWSGVTLSIENQLVILVNSSHSKSRQESDIMHEIAHVVCEHKMGEFAPLSDGILLRDYNQDQEKEAEWLGGCLQLPRVALHYHYKIYGHSIDEIAEKFVASTDMVRFRLNVCRVKR